MDPDDLIVSLVWSFAAAGGTSLAALTDFPAGWTRKDQTLFWAYLSMPLFLAAILLSRVIYRSIEIFMSVVALVTLFGLVWGSANHETLVALPFLSKVYSCRSGRCRGHGIRLTQRSY